MQHDQHPAASALAPVHTVPTHLTTADTVLSLGTFSLSSRQLLLLLVGGSVAAALWTRTAGLGGLFPPLGVVLHWSLLVLLTTGVLALTFGQVQGRPLERWLIVVVAYLARPRLSLWQGMREHPCWPASVSPVVAPASASGRLPSRERESRRRKRDEEEQIA